MGKECSPYSIHYEHGDGCSVGQVSLTLHQTGFLGGNTLFLATTRWNVQQKLRSDRVYGKFND